MIEAAAGGGYQVDGTALRSFAQTACVAGQCVEMTVHQVQAALALGTPGGLDRRGHRPRRRSMEYPPGSVGG